MKQWHQLDTMALYKRLRARQSTSNYRLDRVLMSGINEAEGADMDKVEREENRMREANGLAGIRKNILPGTRALIEQHAQFRTDANRRVPIDLDSPQAKAIIETNLCPEVVEPPGLTVTPPMEDVCKTIVVLARLAAEMATVAHSEEGYTDFDGFAYAAIYVDRVIKEQFASQFPSLEHSHMLSQMHLDPLHKYMADRDYRLDPTHCHRTDRVMHLIRDYAEFHLERPWPQDDMEKLAKMIMVDKQLHNIVAPWLRHRNSERQRLVRVSTPGWRDDGWLYKKLKEAQDGDDTKRDFFNAWTTDTDGQATLLIDKDKSQ